MENNLYFEIDIYPFWHKQAILEVQINEPEQRLLLPDYLHILRDVTQDAAYSSHAMARTIPPEDPS